MDDTSAHMNTREAAPIAYPRHHITANPQNIHSKLFFRSLLAFASTSRAHKLEIYTGLGSSTDWIRIPESFLDAFARAPLTHVRTLIFRATSHNTLSLLFDMLAFMPALRALDVRDHISWSDAETAPDVPDFWSSKLPVIRLESLVYEPGVGLHVLAARVIAPSAGTLSAIELHAQRSEKFALNLPLLPRVRRLFASEQALHLIRQCPALSHLRIVVRTREQLDTLRTVLQDAGQRLHFLDIRRRMSNFDHEDAAQLVATVTALRTLRRVAVRTSDPYDAALANLVRTVCFQRRIRLRFESDAEAYAAF